MNDPNMEHLPEVPLDSAFKPKLRDLLHTLGLDVSFDRGEGSWLYHRDREGREVRVLDMVGGYGSLLLGHNHPALVAEARALLDAGRPFHVQGSVRPYAEKLAAELSRRAGGGYRAVFANSGTEAVEAAMKHAMLETGSRRFLTLERGFHGKTLGALQLAGNATHRPEPLGIPGLEVVRVAANDLDALEAAFSGAAEGFAGFVFEPVLGEGGARPLDAAFVRRAEELCRAHGIPMIADECQTGLGRTGHFLASHALGVEPDYVILSKALGGGIAKISALLIREARFQEDFDFLHTSTYADDDFSCGLALKTLELIDESLLRACRERGDQLRRGLESLAARYPGVIAEVRGVGLMLGVAFHPQTFSPSFLLRYTSTLEDLAYLVAGYLFNVHQIRIAPTLGDRFTLRIEPSALLADEEIDMLLAALGDVCDLLRDGDAAGLTAFLTGRPPESSPRFLRGDVRFCSLQPSPRVLTGPESSVTNVGWVCHLIDSEGLGSLDPGFENVPDGAREELLENWISRANPVLMNSVDVHSRTGAKVRLHVVLLPFTSGWVKRGLDSGQTRLARELVDRGVDMAQSMGASMVALGQYTSIITANGTCAGATDCGLTTGNSYAIALAMEALWRARRTRGLSPGRSTLVIAGAGGNIGRTCAEILARSFARVLLVGSGKPGARRRLEQFSKGIPNATVTDDPGAVRQGDVVVLALNAVDAPFGPEHFKPDAIVCDLSVPSGVQADLGKSRPGILLLRGGIVRLPGDENLGITGFPLPTGQTYGCMAEAILLGLEGVRDRTYTGALTPTKVLDVAKMARKHGFTLADYKTECVLGAAAPRKNLQAS